MQTSVALSAGAIQELCWAVGPIGNARYLLWMGHVMVFLMSSSVSSQRGMASVSVVLIGMVMALL